MVDWYVKICTKAKDRKKKINKKCDIYINKWCNKKMI